MTEPDGQVHAVQSGVSRNGAAEFGLSLVRQIKNDSDGQTHMRLPLGISPIRPACQHCGAKTMFAGRQPHPTRGLPWEVQVFVCTECSGVTSRQPGSDPATSMSEAAAAAPSWASEYGIHTAVLDGQTCRIVAYPRGSPLAGKYGCYCNGRYTGLTADLAAAKTWCSALARNAGNGTPGPIDPTRGGRHLRIVTCAQWMGGQHHERRRPRASDEERPRPFTHR